jgi:hypothetical protein
MNFYIFHIQSLKNISFCKSRQWARAFSLMRFIYLTQRRTTVGRTSSGRVISSSQRLLLYNTQHLQLTDNHALGGIRTHNRNRRAAANLGLIPRFHWDRRKLIYDKAYLISVHSFVCYSKCKYSIQIFISSRILR